VRNLTAAFFCTAILCKAAFVACLAATEALACVLLRASVVSFFGSAAAFSFTSVLTGAFFIASLTATFAGTCVLLRASVELLASFFRVALLLAAFAFILFAFVFSLVFTSGNGACHDSTDC